MNTIIKKIGLLVSMLLTILPISAFDFEFMNLRYKVISLDEMTCKLIGKVDGAEEAIINVPASVSYKGKDFKVIEISERAFYNDQDIAEVNMSDASNLSKIGASAFQDCENLHEVILSPACHVINAKTFLNCTKIERITIPSSCEAIGEEAFSGCTSLQYVIIEQSETPLILRWKEEKRYSDIYCKFGQFANCPIRELDIQRNIEYDGMLNIYSEIKYERADFCYCSPWIDQCTESLIIGPKVSRIPYNLLLKANPINLYLQESNSELDIEPITTYIDDYYNVYISERYGCILIKNFINNTDDARDFIRELLYDWRNLEFIFWGRKVIAKRFDGGYNDGSYNDKSVSACVTSISSFELGSSLTEFGTVASCYAYCLTSIKWNEVIKECSIFEYTPLLNELDFPNSLEKISGFNGASNVKEIHFGNNIKEIKGFRDLNVDAIYISAPTPPDMNAFSDNTYIESTVYVPFGSINAYSQAPNWKNFWNIKESQQTSIESIRDSNNLIDVVVKFDCLGNIVDDQYKGIVIVHYSDGSTKKILQ